MIRVALVLIAAWGLVACGGDPAPGAARPAGEAPPVDVRAAGAREPARVRLREVLTERGDDAPFLADLPPAHTVHAEPEENRHVPGQIDTVRTYRYDGLTIEAYDVTDGPTFIRRVEVTSGAYETAEGLSVGDGRGEVEAVLGPPVGEDGGTVIYETGGEPTPTTVEVRYEPGEDGVQRAASVEWRPYLD